MILKTLKWVSITTFGALLVFAVNFWYFKPFTINLFFARTALQFALDSPQMLSNLRIFNKIGLTWFEDDLDDESLAAGDRAFARLKKAYATLNSYDDASLDAADKMSKDVAMSLLQIAVDGEPFRYHNYPLNQMFGAQSNFPSFMESTHQVHSVGDARNYIARLSKVDTQFDQVMEGLKYREAHAIIPPRFVIDRVLDEMKAFVATKPEDNILYTSLQEKFAKDDHVRPDQEKALLQAASVEITRTVYPAYQGFIDYYTALKDKATTDDGVWKLPNGDAFYRLALKFFTTTDYTPEYIHDVGLSEVVRIQGEMMKILAEQGIDTSAGFHSAMTTLADDPRFYYPDTDAGRAQIMTDYQAILEEINAGLDPAFDVRPKAKLVVKRVPEFKEKTSPGAYYDGPAMDGSRPGTFYANLYDIKATPKYGMRTLAYHEGIPGHHFQIGIQQELKNIPFFRKLVPFTAYAEGWALYAERLAWEMGFEKDPVDNLGRLQAELFRGVRLVVDTGIHFKHWTRAQGIEYMQQNTAMAHSDVVAEIERYIVFPGQACAYKVGMMKILELRALAKRELGEKFDLRAFHKVVLTNGSVPLTILEKLVRNYIARVQAAQDQDDSTS